MNCCDAFGSCRQGRDCPVRRQPPYPATLPPDLPVWPDRSPPARRRAASLAKSLAGRAACIVALMCAAGSVAVWLAMSTT